MARAPSKPTRKSPAKKKSVKRAVASTPGSVARKKPAPRKPATSAKKAAPRKAPARTRNATPASAPVRILVENVNVPGYKSSVDAAKYATVRAALLATLAKRAPGLTQADMIEAVRARLTGELADKAGWWTKCVQLDLEAKKLVAREATKPLRWHLAQ